MDFDILNLNVTPGSNEPLICTHQSVRDAEIKELEDHLRALAVMFEIALLLLLEKDD